MAEKKKSTKASKESEEVKEPKKPVRRKKAAPKVEEAAVRHIPVKPKKAPIPKGEKFYGTGRRKEAVAKVWLKAGKGIILVNGKDYVHYFCGRKLLEFQVTRPLVVVDVRNAYDVFAEAFGGGIPGQAGAVSLGIARALMRANPEFRTKLKKEGLIRRDPRTKERKKYGLKRARRAFQFSKR